MIKINLGCGHSKIEDFLNLDINRNVGPDIVHDITRTLPFKDGEVGEVWLIHVIEHIQEKYHLNLFKEINRVLAYEGILVMAYPEFSRCATNYLINAKGMRDFWKATIYGRQNTPSDFHVSLIDTPLLIPVLTGLGFSIVTTPQEGAEYYTVLKGIKLRNVETREDVIRNEVFNWG